MHVCVCVCVCVCACMRVCVCVHVCLYVSHVVHFNAHAQSPTHVPMHNAHTHTSPHAIALSTHSWEGGDVCLLQKGDTLVEVISNGLCETDKTKQAKTKNSETARVLIMVRKPHWPATEVEGTFDLPLMNALDWAKTSGNCVTIDVCPLTSLGSEVLIMSTPSHTEIFKQQTCYELNLK